MGDFNEQDLDELKRGLSISKDRDNRRAVNGRIIRASLQSPIMANVDVANNFTFLDVGLDTFISPDTNAAEIPEVNFEPFNIFSATTDEKEMQQRLCAYLTACGLELPTVDDVEETPGTRANPQGEMHQEVQEKAMSLTLMKMYGEDLRGDEERPTKLRRISKGLQVTTTSSLCDVAVDSGNDDFPKELCVGELKHRGSYTQSQAIAQALLYMLTVLYWLRVKMGLHVPCVYGYAVCGPKCANVDFYSITLLKISEPKQIGKPFIFEGCTYAASAPYDAVPMDTLLRFLKNGKRCMADSQLKGSQIPPELRAPAYFALPSAFWVDDSPEYELVRGGTIAIVFRATMNGVRLLLGNGRRFRPIRRDVQTAVGLLERMKNFLETARGRTFPYFVKFQVSGVSNGVSEDFFLLLEDDNFSPELKKTYIASGTGEDSYCLVMRNRGEPVDDNTFVRYDDLKSAFQCVWDTAHELLTTLPPCDSLVHNMVYDGRSLHLIDVDEGQRVGVPIKERIVDEDGIGGYGSFLNYPNCLRKRYADYALVQLAVSFVTIALINTQVSVGAQQDTEFNLLVQQVMALGQALSLNMRGPFDPKYDPPALIADPLGEIRKIMSSWFG